MEKKTQPPLSSIAILQSQLLISFVLHGIIRSLDDFLGSCDYSAQDRPAVIT